MLETILCLNCSNIMKRKFTEISFHREVFSGIIYMLFYILNLWEYIVAFFKT
eukprot:UN15986